MARIRTIKPDFWVDEVMADLDPVAKLLFIGMFNFVDDDGYVEDSARRLKMQIFPGNDYDVQKALEALCEAGRVVRCVSDQGSILWVKNFLRHQVISHPTKTKYTGIRTLNDEPIPESSGEFASSPEPSALKGREGKGKEKNGGGGESEPGGSQEPPPRRCPKHIDDPDSPACGACRDARLAREDYDKAHRWDIPSFAAAPYVPPIGDIELNAVGCAHKWDAAGWCLRCAASREQVPA